MAGPLHAETAAVQPVPLTLEEMVVTAAGYEQRVEDAPASITVIEGEDLRRKSYRDLGDAVRDV
jgi:outer membrane receptor for ferrienterochelin and colicins